jgi:nicotinamide-nucleotide amidase
MTYPTSNDLISLVQTMADVLGKKQWTLASAESCTGGWLAKTCTDLAGSSTWFDCGFVTYSNQSKQDLVNVSKKTLETYGAVSKQTAIEMAQGALSHSSADISVAITGIAGPDGGTVEKPVGTVWFAWAIKSQYTKTQKYQFEGDREQVRIQAVIAALQGIIKNARD